MMTLFMPQVDGSITFLTFVTCDAARQYFAIGDHQMGYACLNFFL